MDAWFSPLTTQTLAPHPLASRRKLLSGPYPGAPAGAVFGKNNLFFFQKNSCSVRINVTLNVWLGINVTLNVWLGI